jgi:hypothetical protein
MVKRGWQDTTCPGGALGWIEVIEAQKHETAKATSTPIVGHHGTLHRSPIVSEPDARTAQAEPGYTIRMPRGVKLGNCSLVPSSKIASRAPAPGSCATKAVPMLVGFQQQVQDLG